MITVCCCLQGTYQGYVTALPTPIKKKPVHKVSKKIVKSKSTVNGVRGHGESISSSSSDKKRFRVESSSHDAALIDVKPVKLPKTLSLIPRTESEELFLWDDSKEKVEFVKCVSHREQLDPLDPLPLHPKRPPGNDKVGYAVLTFNEKSHPNMSEWRSGMT